MLLMLLDTRCTPSKDKLLLKPGGRALPEAPMGLTVQFHIEIKSQRQERTRPVAGVRMGFVEEESISIVLSRTESFCRDDRWRKLSGKRELNCLCKGTEVEQSTRARGEPERVRIGVCSERSGNQASA